MKTITIATGNTYNAKEFLKKAGFVFDCYRKAWVLNGEYNKEEWENKYASATWNGRRNAKICQEVKFAVTQVSAIIAI